LSSPRVGLFRLASPHTESSFAFRPGLFVSPFVESDWIGRGSFSFSFLITTSVLRALPDHVRASCYGFFSAELTFPPFSLEPFFLILRAFRSFFPLDVVFPSRPFKRDYFPPTPVPPPDIERPSRGRPTPAQSPEPRERPTPPPPLPQGFFLFLRGPLFSSTSRFRGLYSPHP